MHNYHTHVHFCRHASGGAADYAEEAVKQGIKVLGFSDHTPLPDSRWQSMRMPLADLAAYVEDVKTAQQNYAGVLQILLGAECEYLPEYENFYKEVLLGKYQFAYLALGQHFYSKNGTWQGTGGIRTIKELKLYGESIKSALESGLFAFVAHPDLFASTFADWTKEAVYIWQDVFQLAKGLEIPFEINTNGWRKPPVQAGKTRRQPFPWLPFWELAAKVGVKAIVNSDAHVPQDVAAGLRQGHAFAAELGLAVVNLVE